MLAPSYQTTSLVSRPHNPPQSCAGEGEGGDEGAVKVVQQLRAGAVRCLFRMPGMRPMPVGLEPEPVRMLPHRLLYKPLAPCPSLTVARTSSGLSHSLSGVLLPPPVSLSLSPRDLLVPVSLSLGPTIPCLTCAVTYCCLSHSPVDLLCMRTDTATTCFTLMDPLQPVSLSVRELPRPVSLGCCLSHALMDLPLPISL